MTSAGCPIIDFAGSRDDVKGHRLPKCGTVLNYIAPTKGDTCDLLRMKLEEGSGTKHAQRKRVLEDEG